MSVTAPVATTSQRRHDIDWLRVLAVLLIFFYHSARVFDPFEEFYAHNAQGSLVLSFFMTYLEFWHMPLFFLLAGASSWFALRSRGGGRYLGERLKRLLIPFLICHLLLIPPQSYFGLRGHSSYSLGFFRWLPNFFQFNLDDVDGYFLGGYTWGHLWFIFHLFFYSLLALPIFLALKSAWGGKALSRLASWTSHRGVILLWFIPLLFAGELVDEFAGGNPAYGILVFIYGFILMSDARFEAAIDRHKLLAFILGPVALLPVVYLITVGWPKGITGWLDVALTIYIDGLLPWACLLAILGYGRKWLSIGNRALTYFAEASYPYYILHQTVIVTVGFFVVQWRTVIAVKYGVIVLGALIITAALYELVVRRIGVLRFIFGMRPLPKKMA